MTTAVPTQNGGMYRERDGTRLAGAIDVALLKAIQREKQKGNKSIVYDESDNSTAMHDLVCSLTPEAEKRLRVTRGASYFGTTEARIPYITTLGGFFLTTDGDSEQAFEGLDGEDKEDIIRREVAKCFRFVGVNMDNVRIDGRNATPPQVGSAIPIGAIATITTRIDRPIPPFHSVKLFVDPRRPIDRPGVTGESYARRSTFTVAPICTDDVADQMASRVRRFLKTKEKAAGDAKHTYASRKQADDSTLFSDDYKQASNYIHGILGFCLAFYEAVEMNSAELKALASAAATPAAPAAAEVAQEEAAEGQGASSGGAAAAAAAKNAAGEKAKKDEVSNNLKGLAIVLGIEKPPAGAKKDEIAGVNQIGIKMLKHIFRDRSREPRASSDNVATITANANELVTQAVAEAFHANNQEIGKTLFMAQQGNPEPGGYQSNLIQFK